MGIQAFLLGPKRRWLEQSKFNSVGEGFHSRSPTDWSCDADQMVVWTRSHLTIGSGGIHTNRRTGWSHDRTEFKCPKKYIGRSRKKGWLIETCICGWTWKWWVGEYILIPNATEMNMVGRAESIHHCVPCRILVNKFRTSWWRIRAIDNSG